MAGTPYKPFVFWSGSRAYTVDDLLVICEEHREEGFQFLMRGDFEKWLEYIGQMDLSQCAREAREAPIDERDRLDRFIECSRSRSGKMTIFEAGGDQSLQELEKIHQILDAAKHRRFTFLLVGRTGTGKSSTVNTLLGKAIAPVGDFEPTTVEVRSYQAYIQGVPCSIVDTPGLCDDLPEKGKDETYLGLIRSKVKSLDCLWFVTRLDETRVTSDEKRGIKLITEALGADVWRRAVIVFTFADRLSTNEFHRYREARSELLRNEIARHGRPSTARKVPSVAVTNVRARTPDGEYWLGELYAKVFTRMDEHGALPFLIATAHRIVARGDLSSSHITRVDSTSGQSPSPGAEAESIGASSSEDDAARRSGRVLVLPVRQNERDPPTDATIDVNLNVNVANAPIPINKQQEKEIREHIKEAIPEILVEIVSKGLDVAVSVASGVATAVGKAAGAAIKLMGRLFAHRRTK